MFLGTTRRCGHVDQNQQITMLRTARTNTAFFHMRTLAALNENMRCLWPYIDDRPARQLQIRRYNHRRHLQSWQACQHVLFYRQYVNM